MSDQPKDKVILDVSDSEALQEHFSRKEPGDTCKLSITGTIDETGTKIVVLSITDVKVQGYEEEGEEDEEPEAEPGEGETEAPETGDDDSPVVAWAKGRKEAKGA